MPFRLKIIFLVGAMLSLAGCYSVENMPSQTFAPTGTFTPSPSVVPTSTLAITPYPTATRTSEKLESTKTPTQVVITSTPTPANVSELPDSELYEWKLFSKGFIQPLGLVSPKDGSDRLFVLEQGGLIYILENGERLERPFLDLRERVSLKGSTVHGLLGMAFDLDYAHNGYFYIHYTESNMLSVIARYRVSGDPDVGDPSSEVQLFEITYPIGEHIGGDLAFGPDGYLYIPIGDGGGGGYNDQAGNAQNPKTLPGSILRLNAQAEALPEVWAYGLRNPWRITFDSLTGDLYIADVGENQWEEIDFVPFGSPAGINFGWPYREGTRRYQGQPSSDVILTDPVAEYDHSFGCAVTGGQVYRGSALPEWYGVYLYGDFCQGNIWGLLHLKDGSWQNERLFQLTGTFISSFGQDEAGEIYLVDYTGEIFRLGRK